MKDSIKEKSELVGIGNRAYQTVENFPNLWKELGP